MADAKPYRILSLDGGGSWALIQVKCLQKLFADVFNNPDPTGREVLAEFDLVVANSGGSLVAAAMAENLRLSEIIKIFDDKSLRSSVFSKLSFFERSILSSVARFFKIGAKYATKRKHQALKEILPKISQADLKDLSHFVAIEGKRKANFVIIAFDYYRNRAELFRTDCDSLPATSAIEQKIRKAEPKSGSDCMVTLVDAIHGSSTAPVNYFNEPANFNVNHKPKYYWDGAVTGNNNPVLSGVVEAICNKGRYGITTVEVLSIGTGTVAQLQADEEIPAKYSELLAVKKSPGLITDVQKMGTSILNDPPDSATFVAYMILNPLMPAKPVDFIRLNPNLRPILTEVNQSKLWDLPAGISAKEYQKLFEMDMDAVEDEEVNLIKKMCDSWLSSNGVPNQTIRSDSSLNCLLGHADFNSAKTDFNSWFTSGN